MSLVLTVRVRPFSRILTEWCLYMRTGVVLSGSTLVRSITSAQ